MSNPSNFSQILRDKHSKLAQASSMAKSRGRVDPKVEAQLELYDYIVTTVLSGDKGVQLDQAIDESPAQKINEIDYVMRLIYFALVLSKSSKEKGKKEANKEERKKGMKRTPKGDFKWLMKFRKNERMRCLVYNHELLPSHLDAVSELVKSISKPEDDHSHDMCMSMHIEKVKKCLANSAQGSDTYVMIKDFLDSIAKSELLATTILPPYQMVDLEEAHFKLTLKDVMGSTRITVVEYMEFFHGQHRLKEPRLSINARRIIQGILMRLHEVHDGSNAYGQLSTENVLLSDNFDVKLRDILIEPDGNEKLREFDFQNLRNIILELIESGANGVREIPKDVRCFLALLRNTYKREYMIMNHSCLWGPYDMLKNILLFKAAYHKSVRFSRGNMDQELQEIVENWIPKIPMGSIYHDLLLDDAGKIKYEDGVAEVLNYLKNAISHVCSKAPNGKQCVITTEKELFVLFPTFIPHFLEFCAESADILSIYVVIATDDSRTTRDMD